MFRNLSIGPGEITGFLKTYYVSFSKLKFLDLRRKNMVTPEMMQNKAMDLFGNDFY